MKSRFARGLMVLLGAALIFIGGGLVPSSTDTPGEAPSANAPASSERGQASGIQHVVHDVLVKNYDRVVHDGSVDLTASIARIQAGEDYPHRNDGSVFGNREGLLPKKPRGYYREYVHPTTGLSGPGPQRIVVGESGDWWYTPDHYASFVSLGQE